MPSSSSAPCSAASSSSSSSCSSTSSSLGSSAAASAFTSPTSFPSSCEVSQPSPPSVVFFGLCVALSDDDTDEPSHSFFGTFAGSFTMTRSPSMSTLTSWPSHRACRPSPRFMSVSTCHRPSSNFFGGSLDSHGSSGSRRMGYTAPPSSRRISIVSKRTVYVASLMKTTTFTTPSMNARSTMTLPLCVNGTKSLRASSSRCCSARARFSSWRLRAATASSSSSSCFLAFFLRLPWSSLSFSSLFLAFSFSLAFFSSSAARSFARSASSCSTASAASASLFGRRNDHRPGTSSSISLSTTQNDTPGLYWICTRT
eukprot:PhM_4_TR2411/c1_g1_i1/m.74300